MRKQQGFTLIEMLVVVAIIGLLSSVVVIGLKGARERSRDARRIADVSEIQNSLEIAYTSASGYPTSIPSVAPQTDPQGNTYKFAATNGNFGYMLGTCLETSEHSTGTATSTCPCTLTCSGTFYYCVNPN